MRRVWFEDLGSVRGISLNGEPATRAALVGGDALSIGPFRLIVQQLAPGETQDAPVGTAVVQRDPVVLAGFAGPIAPAGQELAVLLSLLESLDVELPRAVLLERILAALCAARAGTTSPRCRGCPDLRASPSTGSSETSPWTRRVRVGATRSRRGSEHRSAAEIPLPAVARRGR